MPRMSARRCIVARTPLMALAACGSSGASPDGGGPIDAPSTIDAGLPSTGAIINLSMDSTVGVLLDEVPASMRDRVAAALIAEPASFWTTRAANQTKLIAYRLVFRAQFYDMDKDALPPPPPSSWQFTLKGTPRRQTTGTHDLVVTDYTFTSALLTDTMSPGISEPAIDTVGGEWDEPFTLPLDPELIFQRTRFACMDEAEFPPESVDSEETDSFYDYTCDVEDELSRSACHQTELPTMSCVDAVTAKIGSIDTMLKFTRQPWDPAVADQIRVGPITSFTGADLAVVEEEFKINRTIYRYITPDSCTLVEMCTGAPGWRRLLQFSTADRNVGGYTLTIGSVNYFGDGEDGGTDLSDHGVFEWSACHEHFHFMHYGTFSYGDGSGTASTAKRGFCLQSTNRFSNHELSPLTNQFNDCGYQGVEIGWVDEYKAGLQCQWIDVTGVDTTAAPVTRPLTFVSNPDGFLCEGTPMLDDQGNQIWLPTNFTTATGQPVEKPACNYIPNYAANNTDSYNITLASPGEGYVTDGCDRGQIGPLRNCGFTNTKTAMACTPGAATTFHCTIPTGAAPQVVRLCETSAVLGTGIPCTYQDSLASVNIETTAGVDVAFTCPAARDTTEPGGAAAIYTAPVFGDDTAAAITCTAL